MERYRLAELADVSRVTPRTIRYYIAEGLLPAPIGAGPAAIYTATHRDRLALISVLKDRYLPLREIGPRLATLTDEEVRTELRQLTAVEPLRGEKTPPGEGGAVELFDNVTGQARHKAVSPPVSAGVPTQPQSLPTPHQPALARDHWERITLADGVELHVRTDRLSEAIPLDALVRQARDLLGED